MLVAVQVTDEGQTVLLKLSVLGRIRKVEVERWAKQNSQPGTAMIRDGLGCFRGVDGADCEHKPRDGQRRRRCRSPVRSSCSSPSSSRYRQHWPRAFHSPVGVAQPTDNAP